MENKSNKKIVVYLANLANTYFGCSPSTIPLEIGYLKAYVLSQLPGQVDVQLFRTFENLYEAVQIQKPDLIGCAWYGWNRYLTTNTLAYLKSKFPDIITVVGGANAPANKEDCFRDFKKFPCLDFIIPYEGEIPFAKLVKTFLREGRAALFQKPIDGVFYFSKEQQEVITGEIVPPAEDINIFPSPYLNGCLDSFLEEGLMPVIQTSRGCPYQCAFCVSGKSPWKKIRPFNTERVKKEIDYLETKAKNRTLRFADENFGLLPHDLEIAEFIAQKRKKTDYPSAIRVYTDKHVSDRIKKIIYLLKDLIPMNISTQTLTPAVLKNIRRLNLSPDHLHEAINWAHHHNLNATTELIFGLPGETYQSFMEVINQLVDLHLDSVAFATLMMLKETEINTPRIINGNNYQILYSIAEGGYTKVGSFESVEIDAWAVENKFFRFEDFIKINLFNMIYTFFIDFGYFKEATFMWANRGIKITEIISEILDHPNEYPLFARQLERLKDCIVNNLFKTEEEVQKKFTQYFSQKKGYVGFMNQYILSCILIGEMLHPSNQKKIIDEAFAASLALFEKKGESSSRSEFLEETEFMKTLIKNIIVPFWETPPETIVLSSPYDLIAWCSQDYRRPISDFTLSQPAEYQFKINSLGQYLNFIRENCDEPFYRQSEQFFRTFRTTNIRRYIVSNEKFSNEFSND